LVGIGKLGLASSAVFPKLEADEGVGKGVALQAPGGRVSNDYHWALMETEAAMRNQRYISQCIP
jgi:hypothetical protein